MSHTGHLTRRAVLRALLLAPPAFAACAHRSQFAEFKTSPIVDTLPAPYNRLRADFELKIGPFGSGFYREQTFNNRRLEGDPTTSLEAFGKLPYRKIVAKLQLHSGSDFTILYPAAGSHYAVFEIERQLSLVVPGLGKAHFILTEYEDKRDHGKREKDFERDLTVAFPEFMILAKAKRELHSGYELHYDLLVFGRPLEVVYAINCNTDSDGHSYFKDEYAKRADIVLVHDMFSLSDYRDLPATLAYLFMLNALSDKPQVFIFEDIARVADGKSPSNVYSILPGEVELVREPYGCPGRHYAAAVVYFSNPCELSRLSKNESDFFKLINGLYFEREKKMEQDRMGPVQIYNR